MNAKKNEELSSKHKAVFYKTNGLKALVQT